MIVNRRCSPFVDNSTPDKVGGRRFVSMKVNSSYLPNFNNWKLIDLETGDTSKAFDKNSTSVIYIGDFMPGEAKLFRLAPVMQEGGTLVTNEDCSSVFDCKGEVNNNGYDISIGPGTAINFTDSTARIVMTEGEFKCGISSSENTPPVYLKGKNGNLWKGIKLQNCPEVEIEKTNFEDISPYGLYSTYAVDIINCGFVSVSNCSFLSEPDVNAGGISAIFTAHDNRDIEAYILNNYFEMDDGEIQALTILTSGYVTFPVLVEGNTIESTSGNSFNAMLFAGVEGGAVKNNSMNGYKNGIILIWSAMDFYGNSFKGSYDDSKGMFLYASSYANLGETGKVRTGGSNYISSEGENARCIESDFSFLNLDIGYNIFDIMNYDPGGAFHLSGILPDDMYDDTLNATQNCFQLSGSDTDAVHNMVWPNQDPVIYNFLPYNCGDNPSESMIVFNLGNGIYDTIYTESGGSGGGKRNYQLRIRNYELKENVELITVKSLEDSVSLNLRKRDYERVSELCYEL